MSIADWRRFKAGTNDHAHSLQSRTQLISAWLSPSAQLLHVRFTVPWLHDMITRCLPHIMLRHRERQDEMLDAAARQRVNFNTMLQCNAQSAMYEVRAALAPTLLQLLGDVCSASVTPRTDVVVALRECMWCLPSPIPSWWMLCVFKTIVNTIPPAMAAHLGYHRDKQGHVPVGWVGTYVPVLAL